MKKLAVVVLALLVAGGYADARKVKGSVVSGDEKLSGVIVTDGKNFTQTKPNGKFSFEIEDDAEFVYIVTPAGYAADWSSGVPAFYQRAEGQDKFCFDLLKTDTEKDYTIFAVGDPQPRTLKHFQMFAGKPLEVLSATIEPVKESSVGIALGDICWDEPELLGNWKKEIVRAGIPFYPVVGNHDHNRHAEGDINATAIYRSVMGPENYAFFLGNDVVFVLDNIIYDTNKDYDEGYAPHVVDWVRRVMAYITADKHIYVAHHSPVIDRGTNKKIVGADELFELFKKNQVTFLSGHTHISNFIRHAENITEHNVACICGTWWDVEYATDGTPRGFKVFTKEDGKLTWYYQAIDFPKDHQVEILKPGQTIMHPNSVVANIWDWNPGWKVEWYEDGVYKGAMEHVTDYSPTHATAMIAQYAPKGKTPSKYRQTKLSGHYFAATPNQYASYVTVCAEDNFGKKWVYDVKMNEYVDVQAHRGGAGLMPENTIQAMKHALDMGVNTLELDLQLSKDGLVVVSHDPYFHSRYATRPDGTEVKKDDSKEYIYTMDYEQVAKYDVGKRESIVWPEKACFPAVKPLAEDLIDFVENYTKEMGYSPVRYNIEVKSKHAEGEGKNWPYYHDLADACVKLLLSKHLGDRLVVQCFDHRALNHMHEKFPELHYSYLVDAKAPDFETYMAKLNFTPKWLSPHHSITDETLVKKCREKGMKIVPWTVDKPEDIKRMIDLGVDSIISNYPDRVLEQTRGYVYTSWPE